MINSKILDIIIANDIPFAVIDGKFNIESYDDEVQCSSPDLDIVLKSDSTGIIEDIRNNKEFKTLEFLSFKEKETNTRVDLYLNSLNVGYYHFLNIDDTSFVNHRVSEEEYIIYQLIDPLLKFSKYLPRHKYRLQKYFSEGIPENIFYKLQRIIGYNLTSILLDQILKGKFSVSQLFIRRCKINILFINGNFVRMIKKRLLDHV